MLSGPSLVVSGMPGGAGSGLYLRLMKDTACRQEKGRKPDVGNNASRTTVAFHGHGTADDAEGAEGEEVEPPQNSSGPVLDEDVENGDREDDIDSQFCRRKGIHYVSR